MNKNKEIFYQCPRCESKATYKIGAGGLLFLIGSIMCIFIIGAIIGVPLILISPFAYLIEKKIGKYQYRCKSCSYMFVIDTKEEARD